MQKNIQKKKSKKDTKTLMKCPNTLCCRYCQEFILVAKGCHTIGIYNKKDHLHVAPSH